METWTHSDLNVGYSYVLQPYQRHMNCSGGALLTNYVRHWRSWHQIDKLNALIVNTLGHNQTVWGVQHNVLTDNLTLEYYFYSHAAAFQNGKLWDKINNLFKLNNFNAYSDRIDMISIDIASKENETLLDIEHLDVYNMNPQEWVGPGGTCSIWSVNNTVVHKNNYWFAFKPQMVIQTAKAIQSPIISLITALPMHWKFSFCQAKKRQGWGAYASGVEISDCSKLLTATLQTPLLESHYNGLIDVGIDIDAAGKIIKMCVYATF